MAMYNVQCIVRYVSKCTLTDVALMKTYEDLLYIGIATIVSSIQISNLTDLGSTICTHIT